MAPKDQPSSLPMADLIGGPLASATAAQRRAAEETAKFLAQLGISGKDEEPKDNETPDPAP